LLTTQSIACRGREADDPTLVNEVLRAIGITPSVTQTLNFRAATLEPTPDPSALAPELGE
jgi:hypothetical protein